MEKLGINKRIWEIDCIKAILIILMVAFHLEGQSPLLCRYIYLFHMPIFLVISGYFMNVEKPWHTFKQSLYSIVVPYFWFTLFYSILRFVVQKNDSDVFQVSILFESFFKKPTGTYWYLHTLIICMVPYYFIFRLIKNPVIFKFILLSVVIFIISILTNNIHIEYNKYFLLGVALRQVGFSLLDFKKTSWWMLIPCLYVIYKRQVLEVYSDLDNILFMASMFCLLFYSMNLIQIFGRVKKILMIIGQNTLLVLLISPMITGFTKPLRNWLYWDSTNILYTTIVVVLVLVICYILGYISDYLKMSKILFCKNKILILDL